MTHQVQPESGPEPRLSTNPFVFVIGMVLVATISVYRNRNKPKKVDWVSRLTRNG